MHTVVFAVLPTVVLSGLARTGQFVHLLVHTSCLCIAVAHARRQHSCPWMSWGHQRLRYREIHRNAPEHAERRISVNHNGTPPARLRLRPLRRAPWGQLGIRPCTVSSSLRENALHRQLRGGPIRAPSGRANRCPLAVPQCDYPGMQPPGVEMNWHNQQSLNVTSSHCRNIRRSRMQSASLSGRDSGVMVVCFQWMGWWTLVRPAAGRLRCPQLPTCSWMAPGVHTARGARAI